MNYGREKTMLSDSFESEKETRKVKINISWVFATKVYIEILRNPDAKPDSIQEAKNELLKLAKWADEENQKERF